MEGRRLYSRGECESNGARTDDEGRAPCEFRPVAPLPYEEAAL
jgi:hypothetical protein